MKLAYLQYQDEKFVEIYFIEQRRSSEYTHYD